MEHRLAVAWCREVYHDPTSTKQQIKSAWLCLEILIAEHINEKRWGPPRTEE